MKGHYKLTGRKQSCEFWRIASVRWLTKHWRYLWKHGRCLWKRARLAHRNLELLNRDEVQLLRPDAARCEPPGFGYCLLNRTFLSAYYPSRYC